MQFWVELTKGQDIYSPPARNSCIGKFAHGLTSHVNQGIFAMRLGGVAVSDFEDNCAGLFFDMIKQIFRGIQNVE